MLIEFTVGNFRSFKEKATLSMVAAKINAKNPEIDQNNTFQVNDDLKLLTSAAIYGANASGKSNLVRAMSFMRLFVLNSSRESQAEDLINVTPFLLEPVTATQPSFFEMVFVLNKVVYRYGFEVTGKKVIAEWLFYTPGKKEVRLFTREREEIKMGRDFKGSAALKSLTRSNALFLSVAAQFNNVEAQKILDWYTNNFNVISGLDDKAYGGYTLSKFTEDPTFRDRVMQMIRAADTGIDDIEIKAINIKDEGALPADMPQELKDLIIKNAGDNEKIFSVNTVHVIPNEQSGMELTVQFPMSEESEGTQKFFLLCGPIVDTLMNGKVLIIDEIEARMHTLLNRMIINLLNSEMINLNHAQLIFATHDTNLLSNKIFRRDQVWFVEKDEQKASHLYSLAEIKVRNDASFEEDYLRGKYGGVPFLGEMRNILSDPCDEDEK